MRSRNHRVRSTTTVFDLPDSGHGSIPLNRVSRRSITSPRAGLGARRSLKMNPTASASSSCSARSLAYSTGSWAWSSYRATTGQTDAPEWLNTDGLLAHFGTRRSRAIAAYERFVQAGINAESPWRHVNRQVFPGDDKFVARMQKRALGRPDDLNIPKAPRRSPALSLEKIVAKYHERNAAMRAAWETGEYSYAQIAAHVGVRCTMVGRIVRQGR